VIDGGPNTRTGTATVLFTDLAGSTEARARLGEEAADELSRRHERLLATEISAHRGVVVKTLGDGVMATFGSAANAVAAAIAIQETVRDHNDDLPAPLRVRIGISAGDVAWRGNDCAGTPVIEAARLCAVAGAGEIVSADIVQAMARGRGGHAFVPLGSLELKGLSEPVPASRVRWPGDEGDAPLVTEPAAVVAPPATRERRPSRKIWLAIGGGVAAVFIAGGVALALAGGDDGGDGEESADFCALVDEAPSLGELDDQAAITEAQRTFEDLEAAAPNDEVRSDINTLLTGLSAVETGMLQPGDLQTNATVVAAGVSLTEFINENCPAS
jgi:class 3 adenylate cyclase